VAVVAQKPCRSKKIMVKKSNHQAINASEAQANGTFIVSINEKRQQERLS